MPGHEIVAACWLAYDGVSVGDEAREVEGGQITGRPVTVLQEWYEEHWNAAEDVTPEVLRVIERHMREYSPFEVYAKALYERHRRQEMSDQQWLGGQSRVYPRLDQYQKDGFHRDLRTA
jgi:hypothetical protein